MNGILTTLEKMGIKLNMVLDENKRLKSQLSLAESIIKDKTDEMVYLDDNVFKLKKERDKLLDDNESVRKELRLTQITMRLQSDRIKELEADILEIDQLNMLKTENASLKAGFRYWRSRCEDYQQSFYKCNEELKQVKRDNDKLRLKLTRYWERYGELK